MRSKISQILSIPREGLYIDPLLSLLNSTIFSPHLLLPAALFFHREAAAQPRLAVLSKLLLAFSLLYRINNWLNHWARNNWTRANDWNDWESELVVVTGGSSGIGASVAKSLAVRGTRIAVIDIEPLGYDAGTYTHSLPVLLPTQIAP